MVNTAKAAPGISRNSAATFQKKNGHNHSTLR